MTEPKEIGFPKPYLLELYHRAVEEGCIRVLLHGDETKYKSLYASFNRIRRRGDTQSVALMRPEYYLCTMVWEPDKGTALVIYNQLPDGQELPKFESVKDKRAIPITPPKEVVPPPLPGMTPVDDPGDFDATKMVEGLLSEINLEEGGNEL